MVHFFGNRPRVERNCFHRNETAGFRILVVFLATVHLSGIAFGASAPSGPLKAALAGTSNEPAGTNASPQAEAEAAISKLEAKLAEARQNLAAAAAPGVKQAPAGVS